MTPRDEFLSMAQLLPDQRERSAFGAGVVWALATAADLANKAPRQIVDEIKALQSAAQAESAKTYPPSIAAKFRVLPNG